MKKIFSILALLLMAATGATAQTAPQVPNGDFETWTYDGENLPNNWNSYSTGEGSYLSMFGKGSVKCSNDVRPGSAGQYSCDIVSGSVMGIVAVGNLTSGRIVLGATSASNAANYNYSDRDGSNTKNGVVNPCAMRFTGKPKAVKVWVKFTQGTTQTTYKYAKFSAIIHSDADYKAHNVASNDNDANKALVVASAVNDKIESNGGEWQELTIPFEYTENAVEPAYILINAYTNATPGKGSNGDHLYIDDIEMVYDASPAQYDLTLADGSDAHGMVTFTVDGVAVEKAKKDDVVTVSVTPNDGYSAKDVTVRGYTSWEAAADVLTGGGDNPELVSDVNVTKQENGTWTFTMPEANVWVVVTYAKNLQDAWIEAIADQTYTGSAIEPTIEVKDGETTLTLNTDYTVAYSNNVETGTATVTVTGTGNYSGTATANFTIVADKSALNTAITEAEAYYNSISETNPDAAAALQTAINTAKGVQDNADATQSEIESAAQTLTDALNAAKADVALKRITLTIPAKSYMARIDADKRQIETAVAGVKLYSVKSVTNTEVELTGELSVIAAEMPYFIYNDNDTEVEVSIIVSSEEADNVDYDSEHFKGTLVDKTFTDEDMEEADHYVLSGGSSFVWVKDAGTLSAGKCWIELVPASDAHARTLNIVFEGTTTGINAVNAAATMDGNIYDLSGRRVAQPAKGIYVKNGKKVIVK